MVVSVALMVGSLALSLAVMDASCKFWARPCGGPKFFENFTAALMSGSEILGASMWRPKFLENFTVRL